MRRALTVGGSLAGAALITTAFSLPAGASGLVHSANSTIIGTGSSTTYSMMQQLDVLFNSSPGCQQFVPFPSSTTPQNLDYRCTGPFASPQQINPGHPENPVNDISVQEPALGSSNGIAQLEDQGAHGATATSGGVPISVANNASYARSSRTFNSGDLQGLNFVGYAEDGVAPFHYLTVNAGATTTPSNGVTNLTQAQLQAIYNGTDTNWSQVGGTNAPIVVFSAQEGSGTQGTWKSFMGFDPSAATNQVNCYTPMGGSNTCVGPAVIFENEDAQITPSAFTSSQSAFTSSTNPVWGGGAATVDQIKADAIFFFSNGKYAVSCHVVTNCGGSPLGGDTNALMDVNGVAATQANVLEGLYPVDRFLFNVYSNGFNTNIPAATGATLNYVSELGFICNPNKGGIFPQKDPLTGVAYITEIQRIIEAQGFYPLSAGAATGTINASPIDEGTLPHPASVLLTKTGGANFSMYGYSIYKNFDKFATTGPNSDPSGFCTTFNTDSNANT
jgi:ABC-type phosphate transport system substrate-binding protein